MAWREVKEQRWQEVNHQCEICGCTLSKNKAIGHHKRPKSKGGGNSYSNVEIRCTRCEHIAHEIHKTGNPHYFEVLRIIGQGGNPNHVPRRIIVSAKDWEVSR